MPEATTVLMCRPEYFAVSSRINPWMEPSLPTSVERAIAQWDVLHSAYRSIGIQIERIEPIPGLDDMVFAANGAFVLDGVAYGAKFSVAQRESEAPAYLDRLAELGFRPHLPACVNEGEGDLLVAGEVILGGYGQRTAFEAHEEVSRLFDREVVSLRLVDERYYHLDTALCVLPTGEVAYYPKAFDQAAQAELTRRFPDALTVSDEDAAVLALNCFGAGETVVVSAKAEHFAHQLRDRGLATIGVDLSELMLGGGSIKCATLELRR